MATVTFPDLDPEQNLAATFDASKSVIIHAGAGSGKTRTLIARLVYLLLQGVQPHQILTLTFTRQSAESLRQRVQQALPVADRFKANCLTIRTTHSFGLTLLREFSSAIGLPPHFDVFDTSRVRRSIEIVLVKNDWKHLNQRAVAAYVTLRKLKEWVNGAAPDPHGFEPVFQEYQKLLQSLNGVDFADILIRSRALMRNAEVRELIHRRYQFVLVDEVQDLSELQRDFVLSLLGEEARLTCVGDPNQCIYGWRGACKDIFGDFIQRVPEAAKVPLTTNYRSTPNIVSLTSRFIGIDTKASRQPESHSDVEFVSHSHEGAEFAHHIGWIRARHAEGVSLDQIAVLVRTQSERRAVLQHLRNAAVPCRGNKRSSAVFRNSYLRALFAILRLAVDEADDTSAELALTVYKSGVGAGTVYTLKSSAAVIGASLFAFFTRLVSNDFEPRLLQGKKIPRNLRERVTTLVQTVRHAQTLLRAEVPLAEVVEAVLSDSGLQAQASKHVMDEEAKFANRGDESSGDDDGLFDPKAILAQTAANPETAGRIAAAQTFRPVFDAIESLKKQGRQTSGLSAAAALSDEFANVSPTDSSGVVVLEAGSVSVLTVHAAKGLEWDNVIVHRVNADEFPLSFQRDAEERRVFYVALTRARRRLVLSSLSPGAPKSGVPHAAWNQSPFIPELQMP